MAKTLDILILAGSPRRESYSRGLARRIGQALEAQGAAVELFDLHETPLPLLDPTLRGRAEEHPDAAAPRGIGRPDQAFPKPIDRPLVALHV